jgi:geranylgeranyl pyrophosphate synthase
MALAAGTNISNEQIQHMDVVASHIGLAFQIQDDLLDVLGDSDIIGKPTGKDALRDKPTYPSVIGVASSQVLLKQLTEEALQHLHLATSKGHELQALIAYTL